MGKIINTNDKNRNRKKLLSCFRKMLPYSYRKDNRSIINKIFPKNGKYHWIINLSL